MKIIAIPFAGGNCYSYMALEDYLPKNMTWITLENPGRGGRFTEELLETIDQMVNDIFVQLQMHVKDEPYLIYGHSLGTLLGYELTKKIIQHKMRLPHCLFFTGREAPGTGLEEEIADLPENLFWEKVNEMGGLPKALLEDKNLLEIFYPILKSDFKAIENYTYMPMSKPFPIPIYICMGTEEIGEGKGKSSLNDVQDWDKETIFPYKFELLEGDHFFIFKHPKLLIQKIIEATNSHSYFTGNQHLLRP